VSASGFASGAASRNFQAGVPSSRSRTGSSAATREQSVLSWFLRVSLPTSILEVFAPEILVLFSESSSSILPSSMCYPAKNCVYL
jgi:hypothetical protein